MRPPSLVQQITALLLQEGITFSSFDAEKGAWETSFDVQGKKQPASLFLPNNPTYLFLLSAPISRRLQGHALADLPADVLRAAIKVQSETALARLVFFPPATYFMVSECSVEGLSGPKIRVRLESVAQTAAKLDAALA